MRTIKLTIEYDGTNYCGWQIQPNGVSIQGVICGAVRKMTGEENHVIGASRTDAGVHAAGQVAHFKTRTMIPPIGFMRGINSIIEKDIAVIDAEEADPGFHAQKDAKWKHYRYLILNGGAPSALLMNRCWYVRENLDVQAMRKASECLIGMHDFKGFQSAGSSAKDAVRRIRKITFRGTPPPIPCPSRGEGKGGGDRFIFIDISGDGFVYHMVRNIVGTLVLIGKGREGPEYMKEVLIKKERKLAGVCAPASGLYLIAVSY
jgi:tRNA pseudouridine38-40 synthase